MKQSRSLLLFHKISLIILWAGALCSLIFTIMAGRQNHSIILRLIFAFWVLLPFIALTIINFISKQWAPSALVILNLLMIFITLGSLVFYSGIWSLKTVKPAFIFLVIPLLSWLLMLVIILPVLRRARMRSGK